MPIDESLPSSRTPTNGGNASPGPEIKLSTPARAKVQSMAGGVPPMFASPDARSPRVTGDAMEH